METHDHSVWADEECSCLRPRGHCYRLPQGLCALISLSSFRNVPLMYYYTRNSFSSAVPGFCLSLYAFFSIILKFSRRKWGVRLAIYSYSLYFLMLLFETCGSAVGWGTMLQAGRPRIRFSMRPLDFSIGLIRPAILWPWGRLCL
jgi:hypothetical protein